MKLVIEKDGIKREIEGPFRVCASEADFRTLCESLLRRPRGDFTYGWLDVTEFDRGTPNTPPRKWDE